MPGFCPDFFIAGAPRCGTTSLSSYLRDHPEVCFSSPKETHYFLSSALDPQLRLDPQRYYADRFFPHYDADVHSTTGEGSVTYLYFPHVIERILELNPAARFIVMLRSPMQMVPSFHARMLYVLEEDVEDFAEAWGLQGARARGERIPPDCFLPALLQYSEIGRLGKYVKQLLERVPRSQCLFILHDDLAAHTAAVYQSTLEFLGLAYDGRTEFEIQLASLGYRYRWLQQLIFKPSAAVRAIRDAHWVGSPTARVLRQKLMLYNGLDGCTTMPPGREMRLVLRDHFRSDSEQLADLLGRDLSHWYDEPGEA